MKITIFSLLSLLMTLGLININVQNPISYGTKLVMNISNFFLSDHNDQSSTMKVEAMIDNEFNNRFQLNARYQFGLINQLEKLKDDHKIRNRTVNLRAGYHF